MRAKVGIVTVTHNGLDHLKFFVPSLLMCGFPRDRLRLLVVDNASTDGTADWLAKQEIETLRLEANRGFAAPNNLGISHLSDCKYIALLNNDTTVETGWLDPMLDALESDPKIAMAGAVLANWEGEITDFAGGVLSFTGHAHHLDTGAPLPSAELPPRETLFVCGGAALVRRELFLGLGGFDEDFFAYFEDVDFGWRAWLAGYRIVVVNSSIVRHRHQGTASRLPFAPRMRLYEKNALATILKNYSDENLWPALAGSLLALFARAAAYSSLDLSAFLPPDELPSSAPPDLSSPITGLSAAQLLAAEGIAENWDLWMTKRATVQGMRRRDDKEFLHLFGDFTVPPLLGDEAYAEAHRTIMEIMNIPDIFSKGAGSLNSSIQEPFGWVGK